MMNKVSMHSVPRGVARRTWVAYWRSNRHSIVRCDRSTVSQRAALAQVLPHFTERSQVALVYGGRDCDGTVENDCVRFVRAIPALVDREISRLHHNAEGPVWCRLERPSVAR